MNSISKNNTVQETRQGSFVGTIPSHYAHYAPLQNTCLEKCII